MDLNELYEYWYLPVGVGSIGLLATLLNAFSLEKPHKAMALTGFGGLAIVGVIMQFLRGQNYEGMPLENEYADYDPAYNYVDVNSEHYFPSEAQIGREVSNRILYNMIHPTVHQLPPKVYRNIILQTDEPHIPDYDPYQFSFNLMERPMLRPPTLIGFR